MESLEVLETEKAICEVNISVGESTMHDLEMVQAIETVKAYIYNILYS